jgi:GR25 family glycosyltransferase involved in LPS biosynthesis
MNVTSLAGLPERLRRRLAIHSRLLDTSRRTNSFSAEGDGAIQRIYVINLDRKPDRWHRLRRELSRFRDRSSKPLLHITRRFSAVDARYLDRHPDKKTLRPYYSLADQLLVEPNPHLQVDAKSRAHRIDMTKQEIAIALSHIGVWKLIAVGDAQYTLILEDDVYFRRGFAQRLDRAWLSLVDQARDHAFFDLLYLSFKEVGEAKIGAQQRQLEFLRKPDRGIWQASGYVMSRTGAQKLLKLLPVHGPIDLWLNLKFNKLDVLTCAQPIIEQRVDIPSTNSYSVLPVLSQMGVLTREKPLLFGKQRLPGPIFAYGPPGSGLSALATALSMLGYTCCSDVRELPSEESESLLMKRRDRRFNAYVNVGSLSGQVSSRLATLYPNARFISTGVGEGTSAGVSPERMLDLPHKHRDKWAPLSNFLGLEYPAFPYPECEDIDQRRLRNTSAIDEPTHPFTRLKFDPSPWRVPAEDWRGIAIVPTDRHIRSAVRPTHALSGKSRIDGKAWRLRNDTFPSNLALFTADNFSVDSTGTTRLTFREESTSVRLFTSAAIASGGKFLYGRFGAELRPPATSGLITGLFLHRNQPRQEIDIEFLGKDTTKMLVNVYYNPGVEGTKLEYGYRGTPVLIDLGFDASKKIHLYEIEWYADAIRWRVDGQVVCERLIWNPTPIPDLPMEFNLNLWHSRSKELAGDLDRLAVPSAVEIGSVGITEYRI